MPACPSMGRHATDAGLRHIPRRPGGRGKVTLSGGAEIRILYMNTCDPGQKITTSDCWEQRWPQLVVQNMTLENAYSAVRQTATSSYGGGAIFDEGGQLKVVNSAFIDNRCYKSGPDLGGAAIRALGMVYITHDTFRGSRHSRLPYWRSSGCW